MSKAIEKAEAVARLREIISPGDTVYTILRHVSRSRMSQSISMVKMGEGDPHILDWLACRAGLGLLDPDRGGVMVRGCGMDMGYDLVYRLSRTLWPEGYQCCGEFCGSTDHYNPPRPPRDGEMHHKDGGYALKQRWL